MNFKEKELRADRKYTETLQGSQRAGLTQSSAIVFSYSDSI